MKHLIRLTAGFVVFCLVLNVFIFTGYSLTENASISSSDFLSMTGKLISDYDTPFYVPESSTNITFEESNRLIVKTDSNDALPDDKGAIAKVEGWNSMHILQYSSAEEMQKAFDFYSNQAFVEYVEEDEYIEFYTASYTGNLVSEKPLSWGNDVVGSTFANEVLIKNKVELNEVVVGVFDTGLNINHKDFSDDRILEGYNVFEQNTNITDLNGHGTHVTGIIYNNTLSNTKIKAYKLNSAKFQSNTVSSALFATAIISAVENDGVDVLNMSIRLYATSNYIDDAVEYAYNNDVTIVVSAGNDTQGDGKNANDDYLASKETVLAVSAIDADLTPMLKSKNGEISTNYGTCIDIAAPGEKINSTYIVLDYAEDSGTSMAAPFVTAAVATLKSVNPSITCNEVWEMLKASAYVPENWDSTKYGVGIVDFEKMLSHMLTTKPIFKFCENSKVEIIPTSLNSKIYYTTNKTTPVVDSSLLYTSPISINGVSEVRAIAIEDGKMPSAIATLKIKWSEDITVRYKGTVDLPIPNSTEIKSIYSLHEDIAAINKEDRSIYGVSKGETTITANLKTGQKITYNVTVYYENWQLFIIYFLFGFLWYI